ncbi:conserved exported protein of unknown function [Nitrospira japonica]|uniref:EfeO-type cupredoxin-like domain-containing protein n=2 Tax=Nitrospira japonica TaxID=1325564 RepID=A0A1W1I2Q0_9BACT|nr:conserved exported protein of unknown function [Nitrospira japonica]
MKVRVGSRKSLMRCLCGGAVALAAVGTAAVPAAQAADPEMKIEVTISDKGYNVKGHTMPGSLTAIVVRNEGSMTHGISSPLFKSGVVKKEGAGVEIRGEKGKGFRAYHLEPGQTMTLYFQKETHPDPGTGISETMQVPFWCDIHQHMKGEFLVVETRGEVGGG